MQFYDATLPLQEGMITFPGDPSFQIDPYFQRREGAPFDLSLMSIGTHLGTHVDPPAHYLDGGATADEMPLEAMMGPGVVLDMRGIAKIDRKALEKSPLGDHVRVLLKTDNGPLLLDSSFHKDYVYLTKDGAQYLSSKGVCLVGIDYLSIECYENLGAPVHHILLKAGIVILEGVFLTEVPPGAYDIFCLPLKIKGADGAPARVVLMR